MQVRRFMGEKTYTALKPELKKLMSARDVLRDFEDVANGEAAESARDAIEGINEVLIALGVENDPDEANPTGTPEYEGKKDDPLDGKPVEPLKGQCDFLPK